MTWRLLIDDTDIVEAKLRNQLKKYKDMHNNPKFYRRLTQKFRRANVNQV